MGQDGGARLGEDVVAVDVVPVGRGVDQPAHRLVRHLADRVQEGPPLLRVVLAVHDHDALVRDDHQRVGPHDLLLPVQVEGALVHEDAVHDGYQAGLEVLAHPALGQEGRRSEGDPQEGEEREGRPHGCLRRGGSGVCRRAERGPPATVGPGAPGPQERPGPGPEPGL